MGDGSDNCSIGNAQADTARPASTVTSSPACAPLALGQRRFNVSQRLLICGIPVMTQRRRRLDLFIPMCIEAAAIRQLLSRR